MDQGEEEVRGPLPQKLGGDVSPPPLSKTLTLFMTNILYPIYGLIKIRYPFMTVAAQFLAQLP